MSSVDIEDLMTEWQKEKKNVGSAYAAFSNE